MDVQDDLAADFKCAMRRLASTVAIVTGAHQNRRGGMAATAVCSVGVSPPSLMACIAHSASVHAMIAESGHFGINLLKTRHAPFVRAFSGAMKGEDRFTLGRWRSGPHGVPLLEDAQAAFGCTVQARMDFSGHSLFVGTVDSLAVAIEIEPLLYQNGEFAAARVITAMSA